MDVLTTRTIRYAHEGGDGEREVVLSIFKPFEDEHGGWKCVFDFEPPIPPRRPFGGGVDVIQALVHSLVHARLYIETASWSNRAHWRGLRDWGLPASSAAPSLYQRPEVPAGEGDPGTLAVLATRRLGVPDEEGIETELELTLYMPIQTSDGTWACGFALQPCEGAPIRYGVGEDFIEALLRALAIARDIVERNAPSGWAGSGELLDCSDFPYAHGRSFWTTPPSGAPDAA